MRQRDRELSAVGESSATASAQPDTPGLAFQSDYWVRVEFQKIANKYSRINSTQ
jgi:hypothetical protein